MAQRSLAAGEPAPARERLLRATLEVVGEHGVAGLSHRRVAAAAGVSLGSLTYHFASQEELLREALNRFVSDEAARLQLLARQLQAGGSGPAQLAERVAALVEDDSPRAEQVAQLELYLHAARDPALSEAAARCFAAYEQVAEAAFAAAGVPAAARHARAVVGLLDGLALRRLATGRAAAGETARALLTYAAGALAERGAGAP
jgi:DNA-binding transcriptional regulator YbjK